ncbi:exodeoxyribonuclease VII large subunit [Arthrobacter sp. LjRoot14]|uniref:exodeoxyribonuclease VII large subunit n=1 Tax=Arthrobacter sp. LjRoot14 TaxID=3342265 RepID=UPI003ECC3663
MTFGTVLKITGDTWLGKSGRVCVRVTGIDPDFSRSGDLHFSRKRALAALETAGADPQRLRARYIHADPDTAFAAANISPSRMMVVSSEDGRGLGDFKRRLSAKKGSGPEVVYRHISWPAGGNVRLLQGYLDEADRAGLDLVLLLRGGGPWSDLIGYEREDLALAIRESKVPVATAIGHDADVSVADRAATVSFATPSAAAEAIRRAQWRQFALAKKEADRKAELERRQRARRADEEQLRNRRNDIAKAVQSAKKECENEKRLWATDLARSRNEVVNLDIANKNARAVHTQDLLEAAERRVRFISHVTTAATVTMVAILVGGAGPVLRMFTSVVHPASYWTYWVAVTFGGVVLVFLQRRARKRITQAAPKPHKYPPRTVDDWRAATKAVRSIRGLRKLRYHRPWC